MSALVTTNHVVPVDEPSTQEDSAIESEIEFWEGKKTKLIASTKHIMDKILAMFKAIEDNSRDLRQRLIQLTQELNALNKESAARIAENREADDLDEEFDDYDKTYDSYQDLEDAADRAMSSERESPEIVTLFRKIANKTHPDKTDDPELHLLFRAAKDYRSAKDLEGLQTIWNYLSGKTSTLVSKLMQRLKELQDEVYVLDRNLEYLRASDDYTLLNLFLRDQERVLKATRQRHLEKCSALAQHIAMLKEVLGKREEKPQHLIFG